MAEMSVALASITPYIKAAEGLGVDKQAILAQFSLQPEQLLQPQARLSSAIASQLVAALIEASGDSYIGLASSSFVNMNSYDINGYISSSSESLLNAAVVTAQLHPIISDQRVLYIKENQREVCSYWDTQSENNVLSRNITEHLMSSCVTFARNILCVEGRPLYVGFKHSAPKNGQTLALYESIFQCPLYFEQQQNVLSFDRDLARDGIMPQADSQVCATLTQRARQRIDDSISKKEFIVSVKKLLKNQFAIAETNRENIAQMLNLSSKSLQRKLLAEGMTFKAVVNQARKEQAILLLTNPEISLAYIAEQLGFSEQRSFYRSFKQWTGATPGQYRKEQLN